MFAKEAVLRTAAQETSEPTSGPQVMLMPLAMAEAGKTVEVHAIRGKDEVRRFLHNLGFAEGAQAVSYTHLIGAFRRFYSQLAAGVLTACAGRLVQEQVSGLYRLHIVRLVCIAAFGTFRQAFYLSLIHI